MEKEFSILKLTKTLGNISGYVANILAYLLAITDNLDVPYSSTVSILTLIVTLVILWLWRWPKIIERKSSDASVILLPNQEQLVTNAWWDNLINPIRVTYTRFYNMPLWQRRVEVITLLVLSILAIISGSLKIPSARQEFTGLFCPKASQDIRILVADFEPDSSRQFENNLGSVMSMQMNDLIEVCRYHHYIENFENSEEIGLKYNASLVVWGNNSDDFFYVFLSAPEWEILGIGEGEGLSPQNSQEDIAYLADYVISEIYFNEGNFVDAQNNLRRTLAHAVSRGWEKSRPDLLAEGYFLLGRFFDPAETDLSSDAKEAITAYSNAIELNDLQKAYFNRAWLYFDLGDMENAEDDFSALIDDSPTPSIFTYLGRAEARLRLGRWQEAIHDLEAILQDSSVDETHFLYLELNHIMGKAFLIGGAYNEAENTYQKILPLLNEETASDFEKDLESLVIDYPNNFTLKEEVEKIKLMLQSVPSN